MSRLTNSGTMDKIKKISPEQSEMLFEFTRKHYVEYYDLQNELTDHLANAIEARWVTEPNLSFNEALHFEFKKFGIFGFTGIVEKRQVALGKKYNRLMWGYFKQFFRLPQVLITIALFAIIFKLISYSANAYIFIITALVVIGLVKTITMWVSFRKKVKQTGKKWLFEEVIVRCGGMSSAVFLPCQISSYVFSDTPGLIRTIVMTTFVVAVLLYQYTISFMIPRRAEEHLLKTYPEYNL